ncbi:MAG: hypothetical protein ABJA67_17670 [Chthonomonadales bacterium]
MKKFSYIAALSVPFALGVVPQVASADIGSFVKIGLDQLLATGSRSAASRNGLTLGAGLNIPLNVLHGVQTTIEGDYSRHRGKGNDIAIAALDLVGRLNVLGGKKFAPYVGAGFGLHRTRFAAGKQGFDDGSNIGVQTHSRLGGDAPRETGNKVNFGGKFLAGINLSDRLFAEATYQLNGRTHADRFDAANFTLGLRF